jgi:hypothetical protein
MMAMPMCGYERVVEMVHAGGTELPLEDLFCKRQEGSCKVQYPMKASVSAVVVCKLYQIACQCHRPSAHIL